jgi:hypothetical protein
MHLLVCLSICVSVCLSVSLCVCVQRNAERKSVYDLAWLSRHRPIASALAAAGPGFTDETDPATGYTFLQRAVLADDADGVAFLLELGARVGACGQAPSLDTPLHMATAQGNAALVQALVRADPSAAVAPNVRGRTALHLAAEYGRDTVRTCLLLVCALECVSVRACAYGQRHMYVPVWLYFFHSLTQSHTHTPTLSLSLSHACVRVRPCSPRSLLPTHAC